MRNRRKISGSISAAAALVVSAMALPTHGANLLLNGGFESPVDTSGSNTDSTATGWSFYGSELRAEFANDPAFGGLWGIWHQTFAPGGITDGGIFQNVQHVTPGSTYTLTAWQYWESAAPTVPNLVSDMALTFLTSGGGFAGTVDANSFSDALYTPASSATTGSWIQFTLTGIAPATAAQVQVSFDFVHGSTVTGAQGIFVDEADLEGAGIPFTTSQWGSNGSGDWNQGANWTTGTVPNAIDGEADFLTTPTGWASNSTVYTNTPITLGIMKFDNNHTGEIAGTGNLTIQTGTGSGGLVTANQGTDIVDLPMTIASNTTFNANTGATLIIGNPITVNSGKSLTQTGAGTVTYWSTITVQSNGAASFQSSSYAHALTLAANATATVGTAAGGVILKLDSLSNAGTIDLKGNEMIINYGSGADPISSIQAMLTSGYAGGAWNGPGIDTSAPLVIGGLSYGLGYADSADPGNPAGLASGTIAVRYTLLGDADLNGIVNGLDFGILAANFNKGVTGWDKGDFDYNNIVNGIDFGFLAANFNKGSGIPAGTPAWADPALVAFAQANGLMADLPEPASVGVLAAASVMALSRKRRK